MNINILLADDHTIIRDGLCALLENEPDLTVVGSAANGREAVQKAIAARPDIVIMDIAMPELNGIDAAEQIRSQCPDTRIIILSIYSSPEHIYRAFRAGVTGYLLKESAGTELVTAVHTIHEGRRYLTQRIADTVLDNYLLQHSTSSQRSPVEGLSLREREVLQLVADGFSSGEIAAKLTLSQRTVETYRSRIMSKLDLHDLPSVIRFAIENGLTSGS